MRPRLVVMDATPYGSGPSGAKHRFLELLPRLAALRESDVFEIHWADAAARATAPACPDNVVHAVVGPAGVQGARRLASRRRALRRRHRAAAYTHLFVDHGPVPALPRVRTIVTVHDLRFLHGFSGTLRRLYGRFAYGRVLTRAQAILAVSGSVAAEIAAVWPGLASRVVLAPNAPSPRFGPDPATPRRRQVLVVARDEPRKARGAAVSAAEDAGWPIRVIDGGVTADDLLAAFREATWLLAPSLEEGYDLPVAEALACGTPVIASDIPAHRDLAARGARGLEIVGPPTREAVGWVWPAAVARLRADPPETAAPPPDTWDATARIVADVLLTQQSPAGT